MNILRPADYTNMFDALRCCGANVHSTRYCSRLWSNRHFHIENRLRKDPDPLLTQNPKNFFEIFFKKGLHFKTSRAIMNKLSVRHAVRALSSAG